MKTPTAKGMTGRDVRTETQTAQPDMALIAAMATNLYALMTWLHDKQPPHR